MRAMDKIEDVIDKPLTQEQILKRQLEYSRKQCEKLAQDLVKQLSEKERLEHQAWTMQKLLEQAECFMGQYVGLSESDQRTLKEITALLNGIKER